MALVIETIKYRHKQDKDLVITVLNIDAEDEDYREPALLFINIQILMKTGERGLRGLPTSRASSEESEVAQAGRYL